MELQQDKVSLKNLQAFCKLGSYDLERILGQCLNINIDLYFNLSIAGKTNKIEDTINYVEVSLAIRELAMSKEFYLIENLCEEICDMLFRDFAILEGIKLEITKSIVNADQFTGTPMVTVFRNRA
jgi:dihydroneopterin aldolase